MVFCLALESVNHLWELVSGSYYPMPRDAPRKMKKRSPVQKWGLVKKYDLQLTSKNLMSCRFMPFYTMVSWFQRRVPTSGLLSWGNKNERYDDSQLITIGFTWEKITDGSRNLGIEGDVVSCLYESACPKMTREHISW